MADIIDLDKIGAARREAKKDQPVVQFGGQQFTLPAEMPFAVVEATGRIQRAGNDAEKNAEIAESMADIARALFGEGYRKFLDLGPSVEDLTSLLENIAPAYGLKTVGETEEETPPGVISYEFIQENFEELESDFQREYGIDLRDALFGEHPIGVRRLSALISGLSPDCATIRKVNSDGAEWGTVHELLAVIAEQVDMTNRLLYQIHSKKDSRPWKSLRIPRPYRRKPEPLISSPDEQRGFFTWSEGITVWDPGGADAGTG